MMYQLTTNLHKIKRCVNTTHRKQLTYLKLDVNIQVRKQLQLSRLHFGLFSFNRSVATQGGYFFIFLMTSLKATKAIARTNKYVISAIGIHPLSQGSRNSRHRFLTRLIISKMVFIFKQKCKPPHTNKSPKPQLTFGLIIANIQLSF